MALTYYKNSGLVISFLLLSFCTSDTVTVEKILGASQCAVGSFGLEPGRHLPSPCYPNLMYKVGQNEDGETHVHCLELV